MAPEYIFKRGFNLFHFVAKFPQHSFNGGNCFVDTQYIFAIGRSIDEAKALVDAHYAKLNISCKSIEQVLPDNTTNCDLKRLARPADTLGFTRGVMVKTPAVKAVLSALDSDEDELDSLPNIIQQVANKCGLSVTELETQLEPFV